MVCGGALVGDLVVETEKKRAKERQRPVVRLVVVVEAAVMLQLGLSPRVEEV